jgi:glycosyltransferase involved in cell wall biosynthesis
VRLIAVQRPEVTLDVVGDGPERSALEALADGLPIRFLGELSREGVASRMREADLFVMPSLVEPFGIAAIEALAAGIPTVCTSACGVADIVAEVGGIVVPPRDPVALSHALLTLLDGAQAVHTGTVDLLRRSYGPAAIADRWDTIYQRLHER